VIDIEGDTAYVFLDGDLDVAAVPEVVEAIRLALAMGVARIVVDLGAVTFLDSSGIHAIVTGYHDAARVGAGFAIGPAPARIARVLELCGLRDGLSVEPVVRTERGTRRSGSGAAGSPR
jgi:anti-anti-sigma factor